MNRAFSLILFAFAFGLGHARDIDEVVDVVTGTLYAFDPQTGENSHLVNPIHLNAINSSFVHYMRLDLGSKYGVIDMELTQDSVWSKHSVVVARYGDEAKEVPNTVDSECFVSGQLLSHKGAMSFKRCEEFLGIIHSDPYHYKLEQIGDSKSGSEPLSLKVTIMKSEEGVMGNDGIISPMSEGEKVTSAKRTMSKRQTLNPTVECAITVDAYYIRDMRNNYGIRTHKALHEYILLKWNTIRQLYSNAAEVGVSFNFVLKKLEFWFENPSYYAILEPNAEQVKFLKTFCTNDQSKRYDMRILYSAEVGQARFLGMAFLKTVCGYGDECNLNKSPTTNVKIELHEIGHTLGLDHDEDIPACYNQKVNGKGGIMGSDDMNYFFLPCYRPILRQTAQDKQCLYTEDVQDPVVVT